MTHSGMGLVARPPGLSAPQQGEVLDLEFPLPSGARVRARARIKWKQDSAYPLEGDAISLGVHFESFEGTGQLELNRFLEEHRLRVVVAGASRGLERALELAFRTDVQLVFSGDPAEVERLIDRGDVAAVLLCRDDDYQSVALAQLIEAGSRAATAHLGRPAELKPKVVLAARAGAEMMGELFSSVGVDQALPPDAPVAQIRNAVLSACQSHGMRPKQPASMGELKRVRARLPPALSSSAGSEGPGYTSPAMRDVMGSVRQVAPHRVTVLFQGETGTGKEVLAQKLHELSPRSQARFVAQDCGALPETLLESELFGHVRGAFTGAVGNHPGLFVLADGGTLFLDEIENTTPKLQAKLLRVLETGDVRPVGGATVRRVDVRVVTASNRDLSEEVQRGNFRADLYYRLNTYTIDLPPLRERKDDVLPLARLFIDVFNETLGKTAQDFTPEAEELLLAWDWPGNVRELRNAVERAVLLSSPRESLGPSRLPGSIQRVKNLLISDSDSLRGKLATLERRLIGEALGRNAGVVRRAASELKLDAVTLARRARKLGLLQ